MSMIDYKPLIWWYWFVTACLLTAGVAGYKFGFVLAIGLSLLQLTDFTVREQSLTAFTLQVWFLILVRVAWPEPMQALYWLPVVGTWARSIVGYCAMARLRSLMPWNRRVPFSFALLMKTFFSRPERGSIMQGRSSVLQTAGRA